MKTPAQTKKPFPFRLSIHGRPYENWEINLEELEINFEVAEDGSVLTTLRGKVPDQVALQNSIHNLYTLI